MIPFDVEISAPTAHAPEIELGCQGLPFFRRMGSKQSGDSNPIVANLAIPALFF